MDIHKAEHDWARVCPLARIIDFGWFADRRLHFGLRHPFFEQSKPVNRNRVEKCPPSRKRTQDDRNSYRDYDLLHFIP